MLKKAIIGSVAVVATSTFFFGRDALSYLTTGASSLRNAVRSEVPIEFELERARQEVEELLPAIHDSLRIVAEQQVDVENLRTTIERKQAALEEQEEAILALNEDLKSGEAHFVYAGHSYSAKEVQRDLAERFNRFQTAEATLQDQQQILTSKEQTLQANTDKLEGMLSQKKDLEVQLERLTAKMQTIAARKQISNLSIDDSQLARAKSLINEIDKRLDVEAKMLDAEGNFLGLIPVEMKTEAPVNIAEQVDAYFENDRGICDAVDAKIASRKGE
jgi:DNA repair exonuclease SbcCD ATPase subunit